jgi:hypothetical protein
MHNQYININMNFISAQTCLYEFNKVAIMNFII